MIPVAVTSSSYDDSAMTSVPVLPVLWITLYYALTITMHIQWFGGSGHRQATITLLCEQY